MSLRVALIFGTAGLPHILVRFYTVKVPVASKLTPHPTPCSRGR